MEKRSASDVIWIIHNESTFGCRPKWESFDYITSAQSARSFGSEWKFWWFPLPFEYRSDFFCICNQRINFAMAALAYKCFSILDWSNSIAISILIQQKPFLIPLQRQGCIHGEDLPYFFGAPLVGGLNHFPRNYTKSEVSLSEIVMLYWSNFIRTGWVVNNCRRGRAHPYNARCKFH